MTFDVCIFHLFAILLHSLLWVAALGFEGARDRRRTNGTFFLYEGSVTVVRIAGILTMINGLELNSNSGKARPVGSSLFPFILCHVGSHVSAYP